MQNNMRMHIRLESLHFKDKSKTVRHQACMLLSAAQNKDAIEYLEELLSDEASRDDAVAAIDVLINLNNTN
jgi:HEAT repeat protein